MGERSVELTPDVVILVPPFTLFSARLEKGPVNQFFIHFTTGDFPAGVARREYVFSAEPWIGQLTEESTNLGRFEIRMYAILYELLLQIPEEHGDAPASDGLDPRLKQAMTLMNTLPRSECDNAELSRKVGMSLSHFSHLFREQLGVTPQHYLAGQLMERAFYLLTDPTISIPEIAERLGFANRYHFSAFFKQHTKQSPGAWRKANLPLH